MATANPINPTVVLLDLKRDCPSQFPFEVPLCSASKDSFA